MTLAKKTGSNTRGKIIKAAWKLFYDQGYDSTTVDEIIAESGTSKGSFYHYFSGKDALLSTLAVVFDEKYEELTPRLDERMTTKEKLLFLNREMFLLIENTVDVSLLAGLFSTQLVTKGERTLLDTSRTYYRLIRRIVTEGKSKGELIADMPVGDKEKEVIKIGDQVKLTLFIEKC